MSQILKLTAVAFSMSMTGVLHAGEYGHGSRIDTRDHIENAGVTQTAGLLDIFRGRGSYARHRPGFGAGYGSYGRSGYGYRGHNHGYGPSNGYGRNFRSQSRYRLSGYRPQRGYGYGGGSYGRSGYGSNYGNGYGNGYNGGYGSGYGGRCNY